MVQVIVDGWYLKSVRQIQDILDVVEPLVILDNQSVLNNFRQALEVRSKAIHCRRFIPIAAADMQDDFVGLVGAERGQDFVVVIEIFDGACDDVFRG